MYNEFISLINEIKENNENKNRCFECAMICPNYIVKNYGIFICFVCASFINEAHRLDILEINTENSGDLLLAINYLMCGGNKRFREFLDLFNLNHIQNEEMFKDKNFLKKYKSKACEYYQKILDNEAKNNYNDNMYINFPSIEVGRESIEILEKLTDKVGISNNRL